MASLVSKLVRSVIKQESVKEDNKNETRQEVKKEVKKADVVKTPHQLVSGKTRQGMSMAPSGIVIQNINGSKETLQISQFKKEDFKKTKQTKMKFSKRVKGKLARMKKEAELAKEKMFLIQDWKRIMAHCKKYNSNYDTFEVANETKRPYGWWFQLYAPDGLSFNDLDGIKPVVESNMGCTFMYEVASSNKYATCKIIYEHLVKCNEIPFAPAKVKPYEICPGVHVTGEPMIIDVNASPHILIAGQTRKGKNGAADSIILSWINSCTEKEIELYLFQCAKVDLIKYKNCKHVKCFVLADFEKMLDALKYVVDVEIKRRLDLFEEMFKERKGENIFDYNIMHKDSPLPYTYVILDEFLELMLQSKSRKEENDIKNEILDYIQRIGQMGAGVGVQYMIMHQKPEKALCPTFIKNMSSIRICFGFDDESCGRIVLGDSDGVLVVNLPARRAYVNNNGSLELLYTTNLSDKRDMYIRPQEVCQKLDLFAELAAIKVENAPKPDEKEIKEVETDKTENQTVKKDTGTAPLPATNKNNKNKDLTKEIDIPKDIDTTKKLEVDTNKKKETPIKKEVVKQEEIVVKQEEVKQEEVKQEVAISAKAEAIKKESLTNEEVELGNGLPVISFTLTVVDNQIKVCLPENSESLIQKFEMCDRSDLMGDDTDIKVEIKQEVKVEVTPEVKAEIQPEVKTEIQPEIKVEIQQEIKDAIEIDIKAISEEKQDNSNVVTIESKPEAKKKVARKKKETAKKSETENNVNTKKKESTEINLPDLYSIDISAIDTIQLDIEKIVAENAKKNPNWVPYEPKEGDRVVNLDSVRVAKFYQ